MNKPIAFLLLCLALVSCGKRRGPVTLVSYNVGVFSKYVDNSIPEIADVIRESGATFVALNELDSCNRRHDNYQLKDLAEELGGWFSTGVISTPFHDDAYLFCSSVKSAFTR